MAVATVTQWRATPGKARELIAAFGTGKKIHERLGARVRVMVASVAGPNVGLYNYLLEFDDLAAYAGFSQKLQADAEWQQFFGGIQSNPNPIGTMVSNALLTDVPV